MQIYREYAKRWWEQLGWVLKSKKKDINIYGKIKHELYKYQINRNKILK